MCGIVCAIGRATKPEASHALLTSLLEKTQTRGDDATGFWAAETGTDGAVVYSKEPVRSTEFVKRNDLWRDLKTKNVDLIISHCRKRTPPNGVESVNMNNHPFISQDGRLALCHNGNVPEYSFLKTNYSVRSDCDSEVLLRIIESGAGYEREYLQKEFGEVQLGSQDKAKTIADLTPEQELPPWVPRLMGVKDVFARVNHGAMAVTIGERFDDGSRGLWMFRNDQRPLHVVDMRKTLGQVFIVSTPIIWRDAIEACPDVKKIIPTSHKIIEFPELCAWMIYLPASDQEEMSCYKFKWSRQIKYTTTFEQERPARKQVTLPAPVKIVTNLDLTKSTEPVIPKPGEETQKKTFPVTTTPVSTAPARTIRPTTAPSGRSSDRLNEILEAARKIVSSGLKNIAESSIAECEVTEPPRAAISVESTTVQPIELPEGTATEHSDASAISDVSTVAVVTELEDGTASVEIPIATTGPTNAEITLATDDKKKS